MSSHFSGDLGLDHQSFPITRLKGIDSVSSVKLTGKHTQIGLQRKAKWYYSQNNRKQYDWFTLLNPDLYWVGLIWCDAAHLQSCSFGSFCYICNHRLLPAAKPFTTIFVMSNCPYPIWWGNVRQIELKIKTDYAKNMASKTRTRIK